MGTLAAFNFSCLIDKVTIAQDEKYLTYGMVLCLVTLTDL